MTAIVTQRLRIRPLQPQDQASLVELFTDPTVKKTYMLPDFASRQEAEKLFLRLMALSAEPERFIMALCLEDTCIGILNETEVTEQSVELGYAVLPAYWNRGYCTEALQGAIGYLLDRGCRQILAGAFEENSASIRVMEKCGMERISKTEEIPYRGRVHTCVYYRKEGK